MNAWWQNLSARERLLVMIAAGLVGLLLLSLAIVRPLLELRTDAENRVKAARDGYELTAAAAAVSAGGAPVAGDSQIPIRQAIIESAAAAGIELVRIGAETGGQLEIQAAPVDGDVFFAWLAKLQADYRASVAFADIVRGEAGVVNPQVLVLERR